MPVGVIIVRVPDTWRAQAIGALMRDAIEKLDETSLRGQLTVVEPGRVRQRPLADAGPR